MVVDKNGFITLNGKEEEIKPCPFCGTLGEYIYSKDMLDYDEGHPMRFASFRVYCSNCGASVFANINAYHCAVDAAWTKWQTRH